MHQCRVLRCFCHATIIVILFAGTTAHALPRGGASSGQCHEKFRECLMGCGAPGSNPQCQRYCEEVVLAKCQGAGRASRPTMSAPKAPAGKKTQ
jgi:hypothetical protein